MAARNSEGYQTGPMRALILERVEAALAKANHDRDGGSDDEKAIVLLTNESHLHNVPPTCELHFNITIVSNMFTAPSYARQVDRHRFVYRAVDGLMLPSTATADSVGIHMLRIHCFTFDEWRDRGGVTEKSPQCLGGMSS